MEPDRRSHIGHLGALAYIATSDRVVNEDIQMPVAKVIELVSSSPTSFDDAVRKAVAEAGKTIRGIRGLEVVGFNVKVNDGRLKEYRVNVKVAFGVER